MMIDRFSREALRDPRWAELESSIQRRYAELDAKIGRRAVALDESIDRLQDLLAARNSANVARQIGESIDAQTRWIIALWALVLCAIVPRWVR